MTPPALYKMLPAGGAFRADRGAIPPDPANSDWRDFLAWKAAGNVPDPADVADGTSPGGLLPWQKLIVRLIAKGVITQADVT